MSIVAGLVVVILLIGVLALNQAPLWGWGGALLGVGIASHFLGAPLSLFLALLFPAIGLLLLSWPSINRAWLARPLYRSLRHGFPAISATEREALEAGTVGWDAELFSGAPSWVKLKAIPSLHLSEDEQAFLDGPVEELCAMINDWEIRHEHRTIPDEIWDFLARKGFFGMLISREHGGLGFSAQAQSLILGKIASRSPDVAIVAMVPNSLGPGELIEKYGTDEQKKLYLGRLARGEEIPCFALTSPNAGSDAAAMRDVGVVAMGTYEGREQLGIRITWRKRYITLAPRATLLGLAFHLYDPDDLLGRREENIGITLTLIPVSHKGVKTGRRHLVSGLAFPNGPTEGDDVFIPIGWIIGGREGAGHGWGMLMESLSVGRAISLPATSAAAIKSAFRTTSAYARLRRQFSLPIIRMEGVEEVITRMAENAYLVEAARSMTAAMVSSGQKPAVISALLKYNSTELMRRTMLDAMDIHGGKAICDGPANYLQSGFLAMPVGITVEGANILTRTLITFAQGALRCHPFLRAEMEALQDENHERGLRRFEQALHGHVKWSLANGMAAFLHNLTFARFARGPGHDPRIEIFYRQLAAASRSFAFIGDLTVGLLGGGLKTRQKITGRMADALSELYMLSAVLKRFEDDGEPDDDLILVELCARNCLYRFECSIRGVIANFPIRWAAPLMRIVALPLGARHRPASDRLGKMVAARAARPGPVRDRLTRHIYVSRNIDDPTGLLEIALEKAMDLERPAREIEKAVHRGLIQRHHRNDWFAEAVEKNIVSHEEAEQLRELDELLEKVIAVDSFDPREVTPHYDHSPNAKEARTRSPA